MAKNELDENVSVIGMQPANGLKHMLCEGVPRIYVGHAEAAMAPSVHKSGQHKAQTP